jgi:hypothetical protein
MIKRSRLLLLLLFFFWHVQVNEVVESMKNERSNVKTSKESDTEDKTWHQKTNRTSNNIGRISTETEYQTGRCCFISVWPMTTSDQSGSASKINKPYGYRKDSVIDTLLNHLRKKKTKTKTKKQKATLTDHRLSLNTWMYSDFPFSQA